MVNIASAGLKDKYARKPDHLSLVTIYGMFSKDEHIKYDNTADVARG